MSTEIGPLFPQLRDIDDYICKNQGLAAALAFVEDNDHVTDEEQLDVFLELMGY